MASTVAGLLVALPAAAPAAARPTPPPNPTDSQLAAARNQKAFLAGRVGALGGQIAQAQSALVQLEGQRELAEQKVALAVSKLRDAQAAAAQAKADVAAAGKSASDAHDRFVKFVQASYMDGGVNGDAGTLLSASNPNDLLDEGTIQQYQASAKADAIGDLERATVAKSNADARARAAVQNLGRRAEAAKQAKQAADDDVAAEQVQKAALESSLAQSQQQFDAAQAQLYTLNNQRAVYLRFKAEQARLARIRAARLAAIRAAQLRAQREAAAAAAAAAAARRHRHSNGGGGGSSSGGSTYSSGPSAPTGGGWTAAKGMRAVRRAYSTLGTPYAWAGGGQYGPSYGVCDASNGAPNDCYVDGYDCSGLAMYAWGRSWDHYAATQYYQAGSYHPGAGNLMPGDLIFWSTNGTVGGIHHVAVYKGGGQIIEAPYSGGYVQVAPLYEYGSFFGATRPLT